MQTCELDNLRKRNQQLGDQYMRADMACNHVSEDLIVAKSQLEQLRNECANLRAEKKIWEVSGLKHRAKQIEIDLFLLECAESTG
jgi:nucleoprotein TPR